MKPEFAKISVVGLGYVGLPTAAVFANRGVEVIGVDVNKRAVSLINEGLIHIVEPDLDIMVHAAVTRKTLRATLTPEPADAFILAVPTPFKGRFEPDLSYLEAASKAIAPVLEKGNLVVLESTSPVGTTEAICAWLAAERPDLSFPHEAGEEADVQVAHSPERVLPGRVLIELVNNDRVVGGMTPHCARRTAQLYALAVKGRCLLTTARTAELVKLTENAYRDVNIAFANELSLVCDRLDIDVWEAIELANHHPRVNILKPGPGVGGHCIAVDPWFIVDSARDETPLIQAARAVNDGKPRWVVDKVLEAVRGVGRDRPVVACLGLSYKADIDDLRESPAVDIVEALAETGEAEILVVEPHVDVLPVELEGRAGLRLVDLDNALDAADIMLLLTDHQAFKDLDRTRLAGKMVIDTRGIWG